MLTRAVTDGVMHLSTDEREELAAFLIDSLHDDALAAAAEIDLDATEHVDDDGDPDVDRTSDRLPDAVIDAAT